MSNAQTERLRSLLDERGVEHFEDFFAHITTYNIEGAPFASVTETSTGKLMLSATFLSPEDVVRLTAPSPHELLVEVLRCHDCRWYYKDEMYGDACRWFCRELDSSDGYCAWGERKVVS